MRVDREKIRTLIGALEKRDKLEGGMQPLMALGCFFDLGVEDDSVCVSCRNYETCRIYLKGFAEDENPFVRK